MNEDEFTKATENVPASEKKYVNEIQARKKLKKKKSIKKQK